MLGWFKKSRLHFIGVGGIGMSGIAEVLLDLGYEISGSDVGSSSVTENLRQKGARIFQGHRADHVDGASVVVYSSAINSRNPEVERALELGIPLIRRGEMLAELMRLKFGIAVAGSHGKTTTTGLVATIFKEAEADATHVIGGIVHNLGGNAHKGDGDFLIAEADESDGSFLALSPIMMAVTNIDNDHLDHYGSQEKIVDAFVEFVNRLPFYGLAVLNANDPNSASIKEKVKRPVCWYGIDTEGEYVAKNVSLSAEGATFDLYVRRKKVTTLKTPLLGIHNVSNALAAVAISLEAGLAIEVIQRGLLQFQGVGRRMEKVFGQGSFLVLDDYGHHPTEISATITAIKSVDPRKLCVVFEPHRFTRTQNFWREFQESFGAADEIFISPIYAASENPIEGITSSALVAEMKKSGKNVTYISSLEEMKKLLHERRNSELVFLTLGAGAISKKIRELVKAL